MNSDFYRQFYEARYRAKQSGSMRRLPNFLAAEHERIRRRHVAWMTEHSGGSGGHFLDLGAGRSTYFADSESAIRVDISVAVLSETPGPAVASTLTHLPFQSECANAIVCSQVLEHVDDPGLALDEITRVVKTGGLVLLTVPNRYALMRRRYHRLERRIDQSGHIHEFREGWLRIALEQRGFEVLRCEGACYDVFWLFASLERRRLPNFAWQVLESCSARVIAAVLELDCRLNRRSLRGLSLEVLAVKL